MGPLRSFVTFLKFVAVGFGLLLLVPSSSAQKVGLSGQYSCARALVNGREVPCKAAPLILSTDGKFQLRGWEGSYLVHGEWVELTDSQIKARAKIEPGHKIVLECYGKHGLVQMVYERRKTELGKTQLA
jgi:hypothetical protein